MCSFAMYFSGHNFHLGAIGQVVVGQRILHELYCIIPS